MAFPDLAISFPGLTLPNSIPQNDSFLVTVMTVAASYSLADCFAYWKILDEETNESEAHCRLLLGTKDCAGKHCMRHCVKSMRGHVACFLLSNPLRSPSPTTRILLFGLVCLGIKGVWRDPECCTSLFLINSAVIKKIISLQLKDLFH